MFLQILHVLDLAEKDCGSFISVLMALYYIIERGSFDLVADSYSYVLCWYRAKYTDSLYGILLVCVYIIIGLS